MISLLVRAFCYTVRSSGSIENVYFFVLVAVGVVVIQVCGACTCTCISYAGACMLITRIISTLKVLPTPFEYHQNNELNF